LFGFYLMKSVGLVPEFQNIKRRRSIKVSQKDDFNYDKMFVDRLGKSMGIKNMEDWYEISKEDMINNGGRRMLNRFESVEKVLEHLYPEHRWLGWKFRNQKWNPEKEKHFMDWLGNQLGYKTLEDFHQITLENIKNFGGSGILTKYGSSIIKILKSSYPNHSWSPWKFPHTPKGYWEDHDNQRNFVEWLSKQLKIQKMEDWYRVSIQQIQKLAPNILFQERALADVLKDVYPDYIWDVKKLRSPEKPIKAAQRMLVVILKDIFQSIGDDSDWHFD
jgi:hypothetical protein